MGKRKVKICSFINIKMLVLVSALSISVIGFAGCSSKNHANATTQEEKNPSGKAEDAKDPEENNETQTGDTQEGTLEDSGKDLVQDEDMVPAPLDLNKLNLADKIEESGISYYNFHTTKQTPLPMEEWAKLELISEKGVLVPAYVQFTNVTRDTDKIQEQMKQFMEANNIKLAFNPQPINADDEYVMMDYEILIGKETSLDKDDYISFSAVRFPLQLYSTMRSGTWGEDAESDIDRSVSDVSVIDTNTRLTSGSTMKKTVICSISKGYTAYGVSIPYMNAQGDSQYLCYKLEY